MWKSWFALFAFSFISNNADESADFDYCHKMQVQYDVIPYQSWGRMDRDYHQKAWASKNCDEIVSKSKENGHSHHHHHKHDNGDANGEFCKKMATEHNVVPYQSWGTMDDSQRQHWAELNCDVLLTQTAAAETAAAQKAAALALKQKHIHHHHHHNITNTPHLLHDTSSNFKLLHIDELNVLNLEKALDSLEQSDKNVSYVVIRSSSNQTMEMMAEEIDRFILSRPWWIIESEPYGWFPWSKDLVLFRAAPNIMHYFKAIAHHQFPPVDVCSTTPLLVNNDECNTWGNRIMVVDGMHWRQFPEAIFYVVGSQDGKDGSVIFAEPELCPGVMNKWECLFLPVSNCTLPEDLKQCHEHTCSPKGARFYSNASSIGKLISEEQTNEFAEHMKTHFKVDETITSRAAAPGTMMKSSDLYHISNASTIRMERSSGLEMSTLTFTYGLHMRGNAAFRSRIAMKMFEFRQSTMPVFTPSTKCVAVHLRMGDRHMPGHNMTEWCLECTNNRTFGQGFNNTCVDVHKEDVHFDTHWQDMGCLSPIPFGSLSLDHYINASLAMMPTNRNLYIMTDDPEWLEPHIQRYNNRTIAAEDKFNFFINAASPTHRERSSDASAEFWASIKLAQQCQGFAGHFSSLSTLIIFNALCYRHGHTNFLSCPPTYDVGGVRS